MECDRDCGRAQRGEPGTGEGGKITDDGRKNTCEDRSPDSHAECNEETQPSQSDESFEHEIKGERTEGVNSLDVAAADTQRNVESGSERKHRNQEWIGQIEIIR